MKKIFLLIIAVSSFFLGSGVSKAATPAITNASGSLSGTSLNLSASFTTDKPVSYEFKYNIGSSTSFPYSTGLGTGDNPGRSVSATISNLPAGSTVYYYFSLKYNGSEIDASIPASVVIPAPAKAPAITNASGSLSGTSLNLSASFTTDKPVSYEFKYNIGSSTSFPYSTGLGTGDNPGRSVSATISNLPAGSTVYYYFSLKYNGSEIDASAPASVVIPAQSQAPIVRIQGYSMGGSRADISGFAYSNGRATTWTAKYRTLGSTQWQTAGSGSINSTTTSEQPMNGSFYPAAGIIYEYMFTANNGTEVNTAIQQLIWGGNGGSSTSFASSPSVSTVSGSANSGVATVTGVVTANNATTNWYFDYRVLGASTWSRATAVGSSSISSSVSNQSISATFPVSSSTSYEYRAGATNSVGTSFGSVLNLVIGPSGNPTNNTGGGSSTNSQTYGVSTPATVGLSAVYGDSAILTGSVNSSGLSRVWFEYGTSMSGSTINNAISYGHRLVGNGTYEIVSSIPNLSSLTTYYYRLVSENGGTTYRGEIKQFTTTQGTPSRGIYGQPSVETLSAEYISPNGAVFRAKVNPNGDATTIWFEYGINSVSTFWSHQTSPMSIGAGSEREVIFGVGGLYPQTTYYYRAIAQNPSGTKYGAIQSFTTKAYPVYTPPAKTNSNNRSADREETSKPILRKSDEKKIADSLGKSDSGRFFLDLFSEDNVKAGGESKLSLTYRNAGKDMVGNAMLKIALPPEVEYVGASVSPTSKAGSELKFDLGNLDGGSQGNIEITTKIKKIVEPGSLVAFNAFLEYYDADNKLQTVSGFNTVNVSEKESGFTGSFASFAGSSGNIFTIILLLAILAAFIYMIATRKR